MQVSSSTRRYMRSHLLRILPYLIFTRMFFQRKQKLLDRLLGTKNLLWRSWQMMGMCILATLGQLQFATFPLTGSLKSPLVLDKEKKKRKTIWSAAEIYCKILVFRIAATYITIGKTKNWRIIQRHFLINTWNSNRTRTIFIPESRWCKRSRIQIMVLTKNFPLMLL